MDLDYNRYYQNWHNDSDEHYQMMINSYKTQLIEYLVDVPKSAKIIEIGSGMGFCLLALKELGYINVVGVDLDQGQTERAKQKGLVVYNQSVEEYFIESEEKFDVVLMFDVLEHIDKNKIIPLLKNIYNNITSLGRVIIQVPNCYSVAGSAYRYIDYTHEISFSSYSLDFVLYNSGFSVIDVREVGQLPAISFFGLLRHPFQIRAKLKRIFARNLYRFMLSQEIGDLGNVPLSANIVAIAKK